jgi:hypothetical protein
LFGSLRCCVARRGPCQKRSRLILFRNSRTFRSSSVEALVERGRYTSSSRASTPTGRVQRQVVSHGLDTTLLREFSDGIVVNAVNQYPLKSMWSRVMVAGTNIHQASPLLWLYSSVLTLTILSCSIAVSAF